MSPVLDDIERQLLSPRDSTAFKNALKKLFILAVFTIITYFLINVASSLAENLIDFLFELLDKKESHEFFHIYKYIYDFFNKTLV